MLRQLFLLASVLFCPSAHADMAIAAITIEASENKIVIHGKATGLKESEIQGQMLVIKSDAAGTSNIQQQRTISISPGESTDIATTEISLQPGGTIEVEVILTLNEDEVISKASYQILPMPSD